MHLSELTYSLVVVSVIFFLEVNSGKRSKLLEDSVKSGEVDDDWQKISQMHSR